MTLPPLLRQAIDEVLQTIPKNDLAKASEVLSQRYRAELQDGSFHLSDELFAHAYVASRLPATFAAIKASFEAIKRIRPEFAPKAQLDVGAGPGSALWAAVSVWDSLESALMLEGSPPIRKLGETLAKPLNQKVTWQTLNLNTEFPVNTAFDLVSMAYVLNELETKRRQDLITQLWQTTNATLVIIEPGTSAGHHRLLEARTQLLDLGAHILTPCPHAKACPLSAPDWCHFSQRLSRSQTHKQAKNAELGYEDEKYSFLAVSKVSKVSKYDKSLPEARILATPQSRKGLVQLKLCTKEGDLEQRSVSKRQGEVYKQITRLGWGDEVS